MFGVISHIEHVVCHDLPHEEEREVSVDPHMSDVETTEDFRNVERLKYEIPSHT